MKGFVLGLRLKDLRRRGPYIFLVGRIRHEAGARDLATIVSGRDLSLGDVP